MDKNKVLKLIAFIACSQPLFLLTLKEWASGILIVSTLISIAYILYKKYSQIQLNSNWTSDEIWFIAAFLMPLTSTFLAALLRGDLYWEQFDSPSRFALAALLYASLRDFKLKMSDLLSVSVPMGIFGVCTYQIFTTNSLLPTDNRLTTHFMDPIMFGYIVLSFGLISMCMAIYLPAKRKYLRTLNFFAAGLGFYLSILSQSRTGWIAIPFIFLICILKYRKNSLRFSVIILWLSIILGCFTLLLFNPIFQSRIKAVGDETSNYSTAGVAPDTSIGLRITYLRIALEMVPKKLLSGYGDTAKSNPDFPENAKKYSSAYVQDTIFTVGFHNELLASTVRSGVLGLLSVVAVFFIPFVLFYLKISDALIVGDYSPLYGLIVVMVVAMSSLTIETFGLKFAASHYSCLVAILAADTLRNFKTEEMRRVNENKAS